jgi:hypothetical protein
MIQLSGVGDFMGVNLGFGLKKKVGHQCLIWSSLVGLCLDLDGTSCIGFVLGKVSMLIRLDLGGWTPWLSRFRGFHGREFRV